jgi:hypothetical protein
MSTTTLSVPVALVPLIVEGAEAVAADIAEAIDVTGDLPACRDRLVSLCALLEAIEGAPQNAIDLGVREHGPMLMAAVAQVLPVLQTTVRDLADDDPKKRRREAEHRLVSEFDATLRRTVAQSTRTVSRRLPVAAEFRPLLTEALLEGLRYSAEAVIAAGLDPASFADSLSEFDAVRGALDAAGWGTAEHVDVDAHRDVLQKTLTLRLETERHLRQSAEDTPAADGAERQRQRAHRCALEIETFMHRAGLMIQAGGRDA